MKHSKARVFSLILSLILMLMFVFTGCGQKEGGDSAAGRAENTDREEETLLSENVEPSEGIASAESTGNDSAVTGDEVTAENNESGETAGEVELEVCFGDDGDPFILHLYDNDTAAAIAHHVGTASWRLPIYHYDDYDNWESMQFYDIPDRYEIPSNAETVTSVKGGEVYYSEPNRIVLFYHDSEIESEYTKVGYFDYTDEFVEAVENNPVLEGWDTKIVLIQSID